MSKRRVVILAATALGIIVADQVTKALVRSSFALGETRSVIPGVLWLTRVENTGAAFGILSGQRWLFVAAGVSVLAGIIYVVVRIGPKSAIARTALAMIAAGAFGNLIDRAIAGGVTDFLDLGWWPVFNVADISLDVGVALLVWWLLFSPENRAPAAEASTSQNEPAPLDGSEDTEAHDRA